MSVTSSEITFFLQNSKALFTQAALRARALPPNTVQVWPGGATFSTIQAAVNSITNASPQLQYQVAVGAGTYNERVTLQPYIYVSGSGIDKTFITAPGTSDGMINGTVQANGTGGINELTITATGGGWGTWPVALHVLAAGKFHASGVNMVVTDSGNPGNNLRGITNNQGTQAAQMIIGSCNVSVTAQNNQSVAVAMEGFYNGYTYFIELSTIGAPAANYGVSTAVGCTATLEDSTITGQMYALYNSDGMSPITATNCKINGLVSGGVVVNNTPAAAAAIMPETETAAGMRIFKAGDADAVL
jgi:hypothetical protein